jgi:stress response protein YsnF
MRGRQVKNGEETATIPLAEERMTVSKRPVERRVRIRTVTEEFDDVFTEELVSERVDVQHVAVDQEVSEMPEVRFEGDLTIVPIVEERLVISKRLFVVEEVHIRRMQSVERVEQPVRLRKQRVVVERSESSGEVTEN